MSQTRLGSLTEVTCSIAIGYVVAVLSQIVIFPLMDIHVSVAASMEIAGWFTIISVIRSYIVRRWFNHIKFFQKDTA